MQYLCDITPGQTLYPRDARQRADINRWLFWTSQHFAPAVRVLAWENVFKGMSGKGGPDPVALARGTVDIAALAQVLDRHLAGRTWVTGEALTLADFAVATALIYLEQARLPATGYANLMAWFERVKALGAWERSAAMAAQPAVV